MCILLIGGTGGEGDGGMQPTRKLGRCIGLA